MSNWLLTTLQKRKVVNGYDIKNEIGVNKTTYLQPSEEAIAFTFNEKAFRNKALDDIIYVNVLKQDSKDPSKTTSEDQKTTFDDFESNSKKDIQDFHSELKKLNDLLIHFVEYAKEFAKKFIVNSDDLECSDDNAICIAYTALLTWYDAEPFTLPSTPPKGDINNFVF